MATYLITGGCGFIGSHLADSLCADKHWVRILDDLSTGYFHQAPKEAEVLIGDITDVELVRRAMKGVDGCFHLAAVASVQRSNEAWFATHRTNLSGTIAVLDAARLHGTPVVYASSAAIYGGQQGREPLHEGMAVRPLTAYGADKLGSEQHARVAGFVHGVPTVGLRFFNVYGPRQNGRSPYSGVISIFADRLRRGAPIEVYGNGRQVRDFIYVGDVVRFLTAAMSRATPEESVFNVCTGTPTSIRDLVSSLARICDVAPVVVYHPARAGDIAWSLGSPDFAASRLNVRARFGIFEGLLATMQKADIRREAA